MTKLFLDDERNPEDVTWITMHEGPWDIVRTMDEFKAYLLEHGIPSVISFDNDLGDGQGEGIECAQWMVQEAMDGVLTFPEDFSFTIHSKNNIAAMRIASYLNQFLSRD